MRGPPQLRSTPTSAIDVGLEKLATAHHFDLKRLAEGQARDLKMLAEAQILDQIVADIRRDLDLVWTFGPADVAQKACEVLGVAPSTSVGETLRSCYATMRDTTKSSMVQLPRHIAYCSTKTQLLLKDLMLEDVDGDESQGDLDREACASYGFRTHVGAHPCLYAC